MTVTSAERSFSKLKLLKSYLHSTMTQERLNDLAMIALASGMLEKIDYKFIIEDFISRNTTRSTQIICAMVSTNYLDKIV